MSSESAELQITKHRAFSAPGKALLAGGYLVLFPIYESLVIALSSRMYAVATEVIKNEIRHDDNDDDNNNDDNNDKILSNITVKSPQFKQGEWSYNISFNEINNNEFFLKIVEINQLKNPFIESTIHTIVSYLGMNFFKLNNYNVTINIFSDPGFHSTNETIVKKSIDENDKDEENSSLTFLYHNYPITKVPKTGLGSSACLVTSLTTCLLSCFIQDFDINLELNLNKIHNLSQFSHCKAQGKIGSGFDVASATYGSIIYKRFEPKLINELISISNEMEITNFHNKLVETIDEIDWNFKHLSCSLPKGIKLIMGDIIGGSETTKLVSKVLNWKNLNLKESEILFNDLNNSNLKLINSIENLTNIYNNNLNYYNKLINKLINNTNIELISISEFNKEFAIEFKPLTDIIIAIKEIRKNLKKLTRLSTAEIEPNEQTIILNNCLNLKGVLGGVVPGAGGYDAICLLVAEKSIPDILSKTTNQKFVDEENKGTAIEVNETKDRVECIDTKIFKNVSWLNLYEQAKGITEISIDRFTGLI
ncbi:hypothetical protein B5S32_g4967 [[Candida] boidinii]|nr:hypothetical protein B5S32_g4967 [[Candida] boidinii]